MLTYVSSVKKSCRSLQRIAILLAVLLSGLLPVVSATVHDEEFTFEPLRDPFWPVGYFPENWQAEKNGEDDSSAVVSDWAAPAALIRVNGTSRMGSQTAAIINGEVKSVGDFIEIHYSGKTYQWKLIDIQPGGKVKLERIAVKDSSPGLKKENEK
ncbi:MAG: hypothetical protein PWQ29_184 [Verrucomicrobiota bacterium]|nr:hypothetical protein [Verrucomicrobiota bacterium]MDK2962790.1 hypothetical protein [Verrucomicrobiota bacterium]